MACDSCDDGLVRRAQCGDRDAFDMLVARYRPALAALAFLRTGNREHAEDLAQEALARSWRDLNGLRDPSAFGGWLRTILANACRDWYRRDRSWPASSDDLACATDSPEPGPLPVEIVLRREQQQAWRAALATLPIANQQALLLHVWAEWSYAEVATFLGVPVTTIEGRIYRAKVQLRELVRSGADELLGEPNDRRWKHRKWK